VSIFDNNGVYYPYVLAAPEVGKPACAGLRDSVYVEDVLPVLTKSADYGYESRAHRHATARGCDLLAGRYADN
jgi:hypothetical protein